MPLTPECLRILKEPFGNLIPDKNITIGRLHATLKNAKKIISVGDATTERLISFGIIPNISVIDGKERRMKRGNINNSLSNGDQTDKTIFNELRCCNEAGTISKKAVEILEDALRTSSPVRIIVDGEEDLLALPLFLIVPEGSILMYGQPYEGLVVVKINSKIRKKAKDLMDRIGMD
jgi:GTP-dependent dephospho-CoA kinase